MEDVGQVRSAFAAVLCKRRLRKAWTQVELGARSGLDNSYVSQLENALKTPSLDTIIRISRAFRISPSRLVKEVMAALETPGQAAPRKHP